MNNLKKIGGFFVSIAVIVMLSGCAGEDAPSSEFKGRLYEVTDIPIQLFCADSDPGGNGKSEIAKIISLDNLNNLGESICISSGTEFDLYIAGSPGTVVPDSVILLENFCAGILELRYLADSDGSFKARIQAGYRQTIKITADFNIDSFGINLPVELGVVRNN